ncbi:DUF924 family protein [Piscinibacter gummiphilus]|uniref:DUF924 family protein n=1 Tax=Piscinibacter gummiphilus TaxID=946333 RepID=A0ABZ0D4M6_9BURK|nr:DUF924 family protein [Piscinibacter gummiphilus]WOB10003.1 DUF924 family protein [Piscinibacter gummiphilus]
MDTKAAEVLQFWFGDGPPYADRPEWFRKSDAFDREIERRFAALIETALQDGLAAWAAEPATALARVILLDQFPRNVFRNTPKAFAGDPLALAAARAMVERGQHTALAPVQRVFVYLPFEHAEDLAAQDTSVQLFGDLAREAPEAGAGWLDYAERHHAIVARFGRFPHRNAILGRPSTPEETAFLSQPGSSF